MNSSLQPYNQDRYSRQVLFSKIGEEGQARISRTSVLVVGCGALGSHIAESMARCGVGHVTLVDRDFVEWSNLPRQTLFTEDDAHNAMPKAVAAAAHLQKINSEAKFTVLLDDVSTHNVLHLVEGHDLVLDGTDNLDTRYLLNDACVKLQIPYIYGGVVGTAGMVMPVIPGKGPCLTCLFPEPPDPGDLPTADSAGVLEPAVAAVAAWESSEALRHIVEPDSDPAGLTQFDLWSGSFQKLPVERNLSCLTCARNEFQHLEKENDDWRETPCGRRAVQITPPLDMNLNLDLLAGNLKEHGEVKNNGYFLRFNVDGKQLNIFPTGRMILNGSQDGQLARELHGRYISAQGAM